MNFLKQLPSLFLLMALSVSFIGCESDDVDDDVKANKDITISEFLSDDDNFNTLSEALSRTNLTSILDDEDGDFTLFAPNDDAFERMGVDLGTISDDDLMDILMYHVIQDDRIGFTDLVFENRYYETAAEAGPDDENLSIMLERKDDVLRVNGMVAVSSTQNDFKNGVIYELNDVLSLPNIVDIVSADDDLENLEASLMTASGDLVNLLSGSDVYTVFAPRDEAFDDIADVTSTLTADELSNVLTYHVLTGNLRFDDFEDDQTVTTANGETITIKADVGVLRLEDQQDNDVLVLIQDIQTTNGVVYVINDVLMPSDQ